MHVTKGTDGVPHRTRHYGRPATREGSRRCPPFRPGRSRIARVVGDEGRPRGQAEVESARGQDGDAPEERMKVAVYCRVSTLDQTPENQLIELRTYVAARGWSAVEYVDHGVSGAKDRRPA